MRGIIFTFDIILATLAAALIAFSVFNILDQPRASVYNDIELFYLAHDILAVGEKKGVFPSGDISGLAQVLPGNVCYSFKIAGGATTSKSGCYCEDKTVAKRVVATTEGNYLVTVEVCRR